MRTHYSFIFTGAGCAGLSLLVRLLRSGQFSDKPILVIDKQRDRKNDRTWCFWETNPGFFEEIVYRRWDQLGFIADDFSRQLDIQPYRYKMIRGADFYRYCLAEIAKHPNVDFLYGDVKGIIQEGKMVSIRVEEQTIPASGATVFNSIPAAPDPTAITLLQHFKGWVIETPRPFFEPGVATLMDFRVGQERGTTFAYVLPLSETKALVEYTLFTPSLLLSGEYDRELDDYIRRRLHIDSYTKLEEEFGVIPMTDEKLPFFRNGAYQLGAAGGQTKASSGYTFQFIQKQSQQIADALLQGRSPASIPATPVRFRFYDRTLLHMLYYRRMEGRKVFTTLFRKNGPAAVLRFLDNESSLSDELKIISTLPVWPFLKTAIGAGVRAKGKRQGVNDKRQTREEKGKRRKKKKDERRRFNNNRREGEY